MRLFTTLGLIFLVAACADDDSMPTTDGGRVDAGVDAAVDEQVTPPAGPALPMLPDLGDCPEGWSGRPSHEGVMVCEPWGDSGPEVCPLGEAHFPGRAGCEPIGAACPAGEFADDLPASGVIYVNDDEPDGGDGSLASPFNRIPLAVGEANDGDTIAVAKGTYDEHFSLRAGVTLRGACAAETLITAIEAGANPGIVNILGARTAIHDVQIGGPRPGITATSSSAGVELQGVLIHEATVIGLVVSNGASVTGSTVVVQRTANSSDGRFGQGLSVEDGGTLDLEWVIADQNSSNGLYVIGSGAQATVSKAAFRRTNMRPDGLNGSGLLVSENASATVREVAIEDNQRVSVVVEDSARLEIESFLLRGIRDGEAADPRGTGFTIQSNATAMVRRGAVEAHRDVGLFVTAAELSADDLVVSGTDSRTNDGAGGNGIAVQEGARVVMNRAVFADNQESGILAFDAETSLQLTDLVVVDTLPRDSGTTGLGLVIQGGVDARVERSRFERNFEHAVMVRADASIELIDLTVVDTRPRANDGRFGRGIEISGASGTVTRAHLRECHETAVFISRSDAELADMRVEDTQSRPTGQVGWAMSVANGSTVRAERFAALRSRGVGIGVVGEGSMATLSDISITETMEEACAPAGCPEPAGIGFIAMVSSRASMNRFRIDSSAQAGAMLAMGGEADMSDGEVSNNPIGIAVQAEGFDVMRITQGVEFRDNGVNVDTGTTLAVPDPGFEE